MREEERKERAEHLQRLIELFQRARRAGKFDGKEDVAAVIEEELRKLAGMVELDYAEQLVPEPSGDGQAGEPPAPAGEEEPAEEVDWPRAGELETIHDFRNFTAMVAKGAVSPGDVETAMQRALEREEELKAAIAESTKDEIRRSWNVWPTRDTKKAGLVDMAYHRLLEDMLPVRGFSYSPFSESFEEAAERMAAGVTEEQIEEYAAYVEERRKEQKERRKEYKKALTEPETLKELKTFVDLRSYEDLSAEKKRLYDQLTFEERLQREEERERRQLEQLYQAPDVDVSASIVEAYHEKRDIPLWVVQLSDRVEKPKFNALRRQAKQLGGWYSGYSAGKAEPGFQFETEEKAEEFARIVEGEADAGAEVETKAERRLQKAAEHFAEMAEGTEERAGEKLEANRKTNTRRRLRIARGVEADAREELMMAETMANLAGAMREGEVNLLRGVRYRTDLETLERVLYRARLDYAKEHSKEGPDYKQHERRKKLMAEPYQEKHMAYVRYPFPKANPHLVRALLEHTEGKKGSKRISKWWRRRLSGEMPFDWKANLTGKSLEQFIELYDKAREQGADIRSLPGEPTHYRRMQRMNIQHVRELRAALREYLQYRGEKEEKDELEEELRELRVGAKIEGFFPTPDPVIRTMLNRAGIEDGMRVLEPSAGIGNIANAIRKRYDVDLTVIEIKHSLAKILEKQGYEENLIWGDFLEQTAEEIGRFDRIVMNPPFERGQDIKHVRHAYELLKPGGRLVSIMSEGPFFRKRDKGFRRWLEEEVEGYSEQLPDDAFAGEDAFRQTGVKTRLVAIDKPEEAEPLADLPRGKKEVQNEENRASTEYAIRTAMPEGHYEALPEHVRRRSVDVITRLGELQDALGQRPEMSYQEDEDEAAITVRTAWQAADDAISAIFRQLGYYARGVEAKGEASEPVMQSFEEILRTSERLLENPYSVDPRDVFDGPTDEIPKRLQPQLPFGGSQPAELPDEEEGADVAGRGTHEAQVIASTDAEAAAGQSKGTPEESEARTAPAAGTEVVEVYLDEIYTDPERFQPRGHIYSEASAQRVFENFDRQKLDPLRVWRDPEDGRTYVLAGHSRLEGQRRRREAGRPDSESLPVIYFEGSEEEAIDFAMTENDKGTSLTNAERADYVRLLREEKDMTKAAIKDRAQDLYGRDHTTVIALSYLNPRGKLMMALRQFENTSTGEYQDMQKMAVWIGKLRRYHDYLTDSHEREIFDWLLENFQSKGLKITSFRQFREHVEKVIGRRSFMGEFDASKPLNFQDVPEKSRQQIEVDRQLEEARKELRQAQRALERKRKQVFEKHGQLTEEELNRVLKEENDAVNWHQRKVLEKEREANRARSTLSQTEVSLFDALRENPNALLEDFPLGPFVYIGRALELETTAGRYATEQDGEHDMMFSSAAGDTLLIVPAKYVEEDENLVSDEEAIGLYERWHSFPADSRDFRIQIPEGTWRPAGHGEWIIYQSDKIIRPGDRRGKWNTYRHEFDAGERPAMLLTSGVMLIMNLEINERGIVN